MALFGRKKSDDQTQAEPEEQEFIPDPAKARTWFDHAKTMAGSANFETALVYYASGLKHDPANTEAHQLALQIAVRHLQEGGKRVSSKAARPVDGPHVVDKFALAYLYWLSDIENPSLALKAMEAAVKTEIPEIGRLLAAHVLGIVRRHPKCSKQQLVAVKDLCRAVEAWNEALLAGQAAIEIDPTDASLDSEIKDLSAQRAMSAGGYEEAAGREGGFREFVKDMDKQRALEEEDSIAGVGGGSDRVLDRAKERFEEAPAVAENVNRYGKLLQRQGTPEALKEAEAVYLKGYEATKEYRLRMMAGDVRIQRFRDRLRALEDRLGNDGEDDESINERCEQLRGQMLEFEQKEYTERSEKYPTDRLIRFHLGEVAFRTGDIETAMGCFQKSKDEPRIRTQSGHLLGQCFAREGWHAEAIAEYKDVLSKMDTTEGELEIRYHLMLSLIELATAERSEEHAREALEICSGIARKDITYRDIRSRRKEIDELVKSL